MSTLLNKSYLVKVSTKGEGGQKCPKFCLRGLYTVPRYIHIFICAYEQKFCTKALNRNNFGFGVVIMTHRVKVEIRGINNIFLQIFENHPSN